MNSLPDFLLLMYAVIMHKYYYLSHVFTCTIFPFTLSSDYNICSTKFVTSLELHHNCLGTRSKQEGHTLFRLVKNMGPVCRYK